MDLPQKQLFFQKIILTFFSALLSPFHRRTSSPGSKNQSAFRTTCFPVISSRARLYASS